jgi:hypothetical protein
LTLAPFDFGCVHAFDFSPFDVGSFDAINRISFEFTTFGCTFARWLLKISDFGSLAA